MRNLNLTILFMLLLSFSQSFACDCDAAKSLKDLRDRSYKYADMVFLAEVINYDSTNWSYTARILETFKGDSTIKTITGYYDDSCSTVLYGKGRWLVYGSVRPNGNLSIDRCGATRSDIRPYVTLRGPQPIPYSANPKVDPDRRYREALKDWNEEIEMLRNK